MPVAAPPPPAPVAGDPRTVRLTSAEFGAFRDLIAREAGIHLSDVKRALLVGRLSRRLRELGLSSFADYFERVTSDPAERVRMIDAVCTNETHFFREPRQFEFLEKELVPRWAAEAEAGSRARRLRLWSAASSTGEEPYSIAMSLLHHLRPDAGWSHEVLATDLSTVVLGRAREALWPIAKAAEIPTAYLKEFMLRGVGPQEGRMKAGPGIRAVVEFCRLNLNDDRYDVRGPFDAIFCRNVLIYFSPETKARVLQRLAVHLARGGLLFLGHAESLLGLVPGLRSVGPNVYARA